MNTLQWTNVRNRVATGLAMLFMVLVMAIPVLANSSSWYFYMYRDGRVVDGWNNGVTHNLSAGTLTLSGKIWTAAIYPNPISVQPITVEVRQKTFLSSTLICSSSPVSPSANNIGSSFGVNFSKNCGSIVSSPDYYLFIWRAATDGREIEGNGTLSTP
ncbi:MAG TPA: hypothetical protein VFS21_27150 [Roseiflexaceae bacterium]|nr:hypothetical protein [Roseiflexaceae bacterium]